MALSNEDKKDVAGAFGKKMASKVSKVTRDYGVFRRSFEASKHAEGSEQRKKLNESSRTSEYGRSHKYGADAPHYSLTFKSKKEASDFHGKSAKSKALKKAIKGFDHEQHAKHNRNIDAIDKKFGIGRHDPRNYSK